MDNKEPVSEEVSYFDRICRIFNASHASHPHGVPKAFQRLNPSELRWTIDPHFVLSVFQKAILSVQDPQTRLLIINNLTNLATSNTSQPEHNRFCLQTQIFRGVTGYHYGEPSRGRFITHEDVQDQDFFRMIHFGICAYENTSPEKREKFNKAVMPDVKKQNIAVPPRLQQYIR